MTKKTTQNFTSTRSPNSTKSGTALSAENRCQNPTGGLPKQEKTQWSPFLISSDTLKKLQLQRFTHGLELINLKFAQNLEAQYEPKLEKSKLLPNHFASVWGADGLWKISSTINKDWWELFEHPKQDKVYAVLWINPYTGIVLDQCKKSKDQLASMISRLDDMSNLFLKAAHRMISPEECDSINMPTASAASKRSLKKLSNEAKFLKKDISGMEVLDCVIRTRSLIDRAARVHKDTIPQIFAASKRTTEAREQKAKQGKSGILQTQKTVSVSKPKVRNVQRASNGHSPQSKSRQAPSKRRNVGGAL